MTPPITEKAFDPIALVMKLHSQHDAAGIRAFLHDQDEAEVADLLESLPSRQRQYVWELIPSACQAAVLEAMDDGVRNNLLEDLPEASAVLAISAMDDDELVDVLESVSDELADAVLRSLRNCPEITSRNQGD